MSDYAELIKELRYCKDDAYCSICSRYEQGRCYETLFDDAADAIEALQAEVGKYKDAFGRLSKTAVELEQRVSELKQLPKRGEWELIDGVEPMRWGCSRCKYLSWETSNYCPRCGAKMMEVQE